MSQPQPRYTAIRRELIRPSSFIAAAAAADSRLTFENISYGQLQVLSAVPAQNAASATAADRETSAKVYVEAPPPITEGRGVVKRFLNGDAHIVPMHAEWFCPTEVHSYERRLSPDAEKYMNFRNLIVAKYIQNPEKRLLINDCFEMESEFSYQDTCRIFRFLESWGIINYCANAFPPDRESLSFGSCLVEDVDGAVQFPSAGLNSVHCLIKLDKPKCSVNVSNGDESSELENRIKEKLAEHRCKCCSKPLLADYYQSVKEDKVILCLDCYHEGKFVVGHSSKDFSRLDSHANVDTWTDQETLLLLEALEKYNDDWHEIADHVGSKSKAQCILYFLRMPLDNGLLSNLDSDSCNSIPFLNLGNPVMALVAFLASSFGPKVAAASAQAALSVLANALDELIPEDGSHEETRNPGQHGDISPMDGEMVKSAVKAGLIAAAIKAKLVADQEEREIQRYAAFLTSAQLKRLDLKLTQFTEVDNIFLKQCEQMEKARQKFVMERAIYRTKYQSLLMGNANAVTISNRPANQMPAPMTSFTALLTGSGNQMNHSNHFTSTNQSLSTGNENAVAASNRPANQIPAPPTSFTALLTGSGNQMNHLNHSMSTYQSLSTGNENAVAVSNRPANQTPAPPTSFTALLTCSENQVNHFMSTYQSLSTGDVNAVAESNRPANQMPAPLTSFTALLTGSGNQMNHSNHFMSTYQSLSTGDADTEPVSNRPENLMPAPATSFTALLTGSRNRMNHFMPTYQSISTGDANAMAESNQPANLMPAPMTSFTALLTGSGDQMNHSNHFLPAYQSLSTGNANAVAVSNQPTNPISASPTSFTALLTGSGDQMNHSNHAFSFGPRLPFSVGQPSPSVQPWNGMFDPQGTGQSSSGYSLSSFIPGTSSQFS